MKEILMLVILMLLIIAPFLTIILPVNAQLPFPLDGLPTPFPTPTLTPISVSASTSTPSPTSLPYTNGSALNCGEGAPTWDGNWDAEISSIMLLSSTLQAEEELNVDVNFRNIGKKTGTFNILLYIQKPNGEVVQPDEKKVKDLVVGATKSVRLSYTAPKLSGEYFLSVEIIDDPGRLQLFDSKCKSFSVKSKPEIVISNPKDGEKITWSPEGYTVKGTYSGLEDEFNIYVIVRPLTTGQWWVQNTPTVSNDGCLQANVYFGTEDLGVREDYELYAIITEETLEEGLIEKLPSYDALAKVGVKRVLEVVITGPDEEIVSPPEVEVVDGDYIYTLSGGPSSNTSIVVDDDLEIMVNGKTVFKDYDEVSTYDGRASWKGKPISFSASNGDTLRIITTNHGRIDIELSPLYLHVNGQSEKLSDGVPNTKSNVTMFFDESFTISIPDQTPWTLVILLMITIIFVGAYALRKRGNKAEPEGTYTEEQKKTLDESKIKIPKTDPIPEETVKKNRMIVESLGILAVNHAESGDKIELLNSLQDLKHYTEENVEEINNIIQQLEFIIKNRSEFSDVYVDGIKILVHRIKREYEI